MGSDANSKGSALTGSAKALMSGEKTGKATEVL